MRFELELARRYLRSPGRGLAKITSRLAIIGIAFGIAAMIFALALSRGFREEVQEKLLANTAHITITRSDSEGIENAQQLKNELLNITGIKAITAARYENALLVTAKANAYTVLRAREEIQPDHKDGCYAAVFGSELAQKTELKTGNMVDVIFGIDQQGAPKKMCLIVKDTFTTGLYEYDATQIQLSLADLTQKTGAPPALLEVSVSDIYRSKAIAQRIRERLGEGYKVMDWQEANKPFFAAMIFERRVVLIIISLVLLLSALNITFTLALGVTQRRQDIAILRTAGAKIPNIILAFLLEGCLLGLIGILAGLVLGLASCYATNYFGLINLPAEVYVLNTIMLRPDPLEVAIILLLGFVLTVLATVYPAFSAARIKPWENLARS
jgi:lipoprotein-releasing system permease protein